MSYRILSIDDSKAVHAFLKQCLSDQPCVLSFAHDGEHGVETVSQNAATPFDLIILDWEMPKLTGPEVFDKLKAAGITSPVIMLTSKNDLSDITTMIEKGVADYMMKPFTKDILIDKIRMVLPEF